MDKELQQRKKQMVIIGGGRRRKISSSFSQFTMEIILPINAPRWWIFTDG